MMDLDKEIHSKIEQNYILSSGKLKIDSQYIINKIEQSIVESDMHFKTNVKGHMTPWKYFAENRLP